MHQTSLLPAFDQPVKDAQAIFRSLLKAMSEPGKVGTLPNSIQPIKDIDSTVFTSTWAIARALFDHDTAIYLSPSLSSDTLEKSIQFQTDAKVVREPGLADFAILSSSDDIRPEQFKMGTLEAPHDSCTLLIQLDQTAPLCRFSIVGPGIKDQREIEASEFASGLQQLTQSNNALYPCGLDMVLCAPENFTALPRTTKILSQEGGLNSCM